MAWSWVVLSVFTPLRGELLTGEQCPALWLPKGPSVPRPSWSFPLNLDARDVSPHLELVLVRLLDQDYMTDLLTSDYFQPSFPKELSDGSKSFGMVVWMLRPYLPLRRVLISSLGSQWALRRFVDATQSSKSAFGNFSLRT